MGLSKVLVREKGDTRDSKGLYVICQSKTEPEMYELVCRSVDDRKRWVAKIREANAKCPEEGMYCACILTKQQSTNDLYNFRQQK